MKVPKAQVIYSKEKPSKKWDWDLPSLLELLTIWLYMVVLLAYLLGELLYTQVKNHILEASVAQRKLHFDFPLSQGTKAARH